MTSAQQSTKIRKTRRQQARRQPRTRACNAPEVSVNTHSKPKVTACRQASHNMWSVTVTRIPNFQHASFFKLTAHIS